jgi:hypothetical protein
MARFRSLLLGSSFGLCFLAGPLTAQTLDFGDYSSFSSASSTVVTTLKIGATTDKESAVTSNATATGDDITGSDDEDGVTLPTNIIQGALTTMTVNVTNTTGFSTYLNVWIDFNRNGSLADTGELVLTNSVIANGTSNSNRTVTFTVPLTATAGVAGVRVRLSSGSSPGPTTSIGNGEVEDYVVNIVTSTDFGDYPSFASASQRAGSAQIRIGTAATDTEAANPTTGTATVDDTTDTDDEDLTMPVFTVGAATTLSVPVTATTASLSGTTARAIVFVDWNGDNDVLDANETLAVQTIATGTNTLSFALTPPTGTVPGTKYLRIRVSETNATPAFSGASTLRGEVEDYAITVVSDDFGDYSSFGTASSTLLGTLKIGATTDIEATSTPNATATGDDITESDDEDGVTIPASFAQGSASSMTVNVTNTTGSSAYLNVWIDFNRNDVLTDSGEQVAANTVIATGTSGANRTVTFTVPAGSSLGTAGVRVRLTSTTSPGPTGASGNGEVEDYVVTIASSLGIGNLVWNDANENGLFDPEESGINNVLVELWSPGADNAIGGTGGNADTKVTSMNTAGGGLYNFSGLPAGYYFVKVPTPPLSRTSIVSDPTDNGQDGDNNASQPGGSATAAFSPVIQLAVGTEPGSTGTGYIDNSVDFGFASNIGSPFVCDNRFYIMQNAETSPGSNVWDATLYYIGPGQTLVPIFIFTGYKLNGLAAYGGYLYCVDQNGSNLYRINSQGVLVDMGIIAGLPDPGTTAQWSGATALTNGRMILNLWNISASTTSLYTIDLASATLIGGGVNCTYSTGGNMSGNMGDIAWDPLTNKVYGYNTVDNSNLGLFEINLTTGVCTRVAAAVPGAWGSMVIDANGLAYGYGSAGASGSQDTLYVFNRTSGVLNGSVTAVGTGPAVSNSDGAACPGAPPSMKVGNLIWNDVNNNGLKDTGEAGIDGVSVQLFLGGQNPLTATPAATVTTAGGGLFAFNNLSPGQYLLNIPTPPASFPLSSVVTDTADNGQDNDDNGIQTAQGQPVRSPLIALTAGSEPSNDGDTDINTDLSIDFGFVACPAITVNPASMASATVGSAYTQTFNTTGGTSPYVWAVSSGTLPAGLALNTSTGVISGTPTSGAAASFTLRATDALGCTGTRAYTLTPACLPITITPSTLSAGLVSTAYTQTLTASGGSAPYGSWTVTSGTLPSGLTLNASSGVISGTPTTSTGAAVNVTVRVTDSAGCQGSQVVTIKICPTIAISPNSLANGTVGSLYSQTVAASGGVSPYSYTVSGGTLPTGLSLDPSSGVLAGTPTSTATSAFIVTARDANGCAGTRSFSITPAPNTDFGDFSLFASVSNTNNGSLRLGAAVDYEVAQTTNATATGDDATGADDEDGVAVPASITAGASVTLPVVVTNTSGAAANLNAWIDFNNNGSLADAGEQIATNLLIANGVSAATQNVTFTVPVGASAGSGRGVRLRLTSSSSPGPTGAGGAGEVEDYVVSIAAPTEDFGDFNLFPTASSIGNATLRLGASMDVEGAPTTNATATGDDLTGTDDENGVTVPATITQGAAGSITVNVTNTTGASAYLNAWVDFNGNGVLTDSGEQVATNTAIATATSNSNRTVSFTVPAVVKVGTVGVRVRLTSTANPGPDGQDGTGEVEDVITSIVANTDFGDFTSFPSASSKANSTLRLGALSDSEGADVTNTTATGDDLDGTDDEDGVVVPVSLAQGAAGSLGLTLTNTSGTTAYLNAWIDFNRNGVLTDAGEQVAVNTSIATGTSNANQTINFTAPVAASLGTAGVRVRLTSVITPGADGLDGNGEVEDYTTNIVVPTTDFGDELDFADATSTANNALRLGALVDVEGSSTRNAGATGDDTTGSDDEDGLSFPSVTAGQPVTLPVTVTNNSGAAAFLNAWIDFNNNGSLLDAGEQVATNVSVADGLTDSVINLNFNIPTNAVTAATSLGTRFRLTDSASPAPTGFAGIGEVEDHPIIILAPLTDFGDHSDYADVSNTASTNLRLGALVDTEYASTRNATATGDDTAGNDDEDGVTLPAMTAGAPATIPVTVTNNTGAAAFLNAWIDYNDNGVFGDAGEQIATNTGIANLSTNVVSNIAITVPATATTAASLGVRVRITALSAPGASGAGGVGEVEDYVVTIAAPTTDFGDFTSFGSASSTRNATLKLGALLDTEFVQTVNATATGDDITASDDEDSVTFPSMTAGAPATIPVLVTNTSGAAAFLNAWIDYNNNGTLEAGEQIATNVSIATGSNNLTQNLNITVPAGALTGVNLGARFRLTSTSGAAATGLVGNGEVEDYIVTITAPTTDFGDDLDFADASQGANPFLRMGALIDTEFVSTRNATATGDDTTGSDDEDGVVVPAMIAGQTVTIPVTISNGTGADGFLNAWIDYNNNGVLTDSGEQVATNVLIATGAVNAVTNLSVTVPPTATTGASLGLRFRLSAPSGLGPTGTNGLAGEIEDYAVTIAAPTTDFGDHLSLADASSTQIATIKMGALTDVEFLSTRNVTATGDDTTGSDDEDAVTIPVMTAGSSATIPVLVTNTSGASVNLNAWIDFNNNGSLADAGEQIASNVSIANGSNNITQNIIATVPATATTGVNLPVRVRLTSTPTPGPTGASGNGEVEDYIVNLTNPTTDFGDFASFGSASNAANATLRLGALIDAEFAATTNATATGDDITASDDEDGVTLPTIIAGQTLTVPVVVTNTTGAGAFLNAWIDFNNDGDVLDVGEQVITNVGVANGSSNTTITPSVTAPAAALTGVNLGVRFRLTTTATPAATGVMGSFGEVEDYVISIAVPTTDFGDFTSFADATSTRNATIKLGALTDTEFTSTRNATATGDDTTGSDDEDAVTFPTLMAGAPATIPVLVTNTSGAAVNLNAWIDYNNNGTLEAGEQIASNVSIPTGSNNITQNIAITVPVTALTVTNLGARFRLTSTATPGATGVSGNGEVEDYIVSITNPPLDYGDSSALGSASSTANAALRFGALVDTEFAPTLNATASGDDSTGSDDEDGISIPTLTAGAPGTITATVTNTTGAAAFLNAWIDFNNNGSVADAGEQIATNTNVATGTSNGSIPLNFTVPANATAGANMVLRFRLTSTSTPGITGTVGTGEVEDHVTTIAVPTTDFGDWSGAADASSIASSNLRMGSLADTEFVSTRNATATGDDITGSDDEEGVTLAGGYNLGASGSATVVTTNLSGAAAYLNAWIDYNNTGSFADAGEQIATNTLVPTGTNGVAQALNFTVPATATPGGRGMRLRFTDVQNPTPIGAAGMGEVEDNLLTINCPTLTLAPTTLPTPAVGIIYSQTFTASGGTSPYSYSVTSGTLPTGLTLSTSGILSGIPLSVASQTFSITAADANGCTSNLSYTLTPFCSAISITPVTAASGSVGSAYSQTLTAAGGTSPYSAWTITVGTLPTGLTLNASSGIISGTPTAAASPATSITVRVNDSNGCQGTQIISLKICPVVILSPTSLAAATVGTAYSQTISGSGGTSPYTFAISSGSLPAWASLNTSTGVIIGTPNSTTTANFIIRATDANGCSGTRAYSITPVCPSITITPASLSSAVINAPYSQAVTASVGTAPYVYAIASGALPTGLTLDTSTGVISGIPTSSATATFTIRATDAYGCVGTSSSYSLTPAPNADFGDLSTFGSASSTKNSTLKMGALVDYEYVQTANATATGDDITGSDDEDVVTLPTGAIQGQSGLSVTVNVTNTSGAETYLNGWIDFNNNGVLTDVGEQIVFNEPLATGTSSANMTYTFNVPSIAAIATVGVRFRLTSIANPGSTGASGAGEVEDHTLAIADASDHGDFSLFQDAASKLSNTLKMGDFTDAEPTAVANLAATGDDVTNINDEDGTTVQAILVRGQAGVAVTVNVTNLSGSPAYLNGWADFNNNGALTDTDEQIISNVVVPTGTASDYQTFFFDVPSTAALGVIGTRFRLTSISAPGPVGASGSGEVEDYTTTIVVPATNFRDYFYAIRSTNGNFYLDEISVYNPNSATPTVSVIPGILNLNTATSGFNASASNAYMNGLALDWLNRRFYWNSSSSGSSGYNFQLNTAYYDNVTKTWSYQTVTGSNLSNIPFNTGSPNSSSAGAGAFPRAAYYAGDYYGGGQSNDNMVAWRLDTTGKALKTPAFNDYPNFFHLTQKFGGGDFVIRPQDGLLVTSTAVDNTTNTIFNQFMTDGFNPSGPAATSVNINGQIPVSSNSAVQIAGVGGVTRMYGVSSIGAALHRLDNYDTASPVAVRVGTLPTGSSVKYDDLSEGISSSVTSLGVKGIVYEDTNGLADNTVNGAGSNVGGTLFAMLVDAAGNLVDSFPVKDDGTFILGGASTNTAYTVVLSTSFGSLGGTAPAADLPPGWMNTGEFLGSGAGSDGTVNGRLSVTIASNGLVNAKFGISQAVSVGNLVWNDANNNGLKDVSESGISGVTAQLWTPGSDNAIGGTGLAADTLVATTTTSALGSYGFTNQLQGKYYICVTPPALYGFASSTVVTLDNGVDNDNNGSQPGGRGAQVYSPVVDLAVGKEPGNLASGGIDIDNTIDFGLLTALDFGDNSLLGSAGSTVVSNLFIGSLTDAEYAATTNATATGDNITGLNDEEGVTLPVGLIQGTSGSMTVRVTNTSGSSSYLNVWIDYNNNGVLTDSGEQVAANTLIATGTSNANRTVNVTVPATAFIGNVGVRVRLTSVNTPGSVGTSGNGEVEDHILTIMSPVDYGDYASFASASSTAVNNIYIGTLVDTEPAGVTNATATGDDLTGTDDEDGVTVPSSIAQGAPASIIVNVTNTSGQPTRLSAWIDFNRNGVLTDAGEQIASDTNIAKDTLNANQTINFTVPFTSIIGTAGVRVRLTDANNAASVGLVGNGEVEDYVVSINCPTITLTPTLPAAYLSSSYTQTVTASNGRAPYSYALLSGTLPPGLSLATNGTITGSPNSIGSSTFTVRATDANGCQGSQSFTLTVRGMALGDLVWQDNDNDGIRDAGEPGVPGVVVQLMNPGADNVIGGSSADSQVGTLITTPASGLFTFTNLPPGNYYLRVIPPNGYTHTSGTPATADNNFDNNNDGAQPGGPGTPLFSPIITLAPGTESITDGDTDTDTNLTTDFGLWAPMGVGNIVFIDINGDSTFSPNEGLEGIYVYIFPEGADPATTDPVAAAISDHKGRYFIDGLNPGNYFLHLPVGQFATNEPLAGMIPITSVVAGDDNLGQNLLANATPTNGGASTATFTLTPGGEPAGSAETGYEAFVDDAFIDSNIDFTLDLGLRSPSGTGYPLAQRQRNTNTVTAASPDTTESDNQPETFSAWKDAHPDTDADLYPHLLEYALDTDPADGRSGAGTFTLEVTPLGIADAIYTRPASGRADIRYDLETSLDSLAWAKTTITPSMTIGTDGRQIVRYANLDATTLEPRALFRLKVSLDANLDGTAEQTAVSPSVMFSRETFPIGQRTLSMPLVKVELFAGSVTATDSTVTLPNAVTLPAATELYLEDLTTGLAYEIDESASTSTTLVATEALPPLTRVALRVHHTLGTLLPVDLFTAEDRVLTFDPAANNFTPTDLTATGWAEDLILPKQTGLLVHLRTSEVTLLLTGQVTTIPALKPATVTRLLGSSSVTAESPFRLGLTPENNFRAATDPSAATRLRLWKADADSTQAGYDQLYLSPIMWLRESSPTAENLSETKLLDSFRAFFLVP